MTFIVVVTVIQRLSPPLPIPRKDGNTTVVVVTIIVVIDVAVVIAIVVTVLRAHCPLADEANDDVIV